MSLGDTAPHLTVHQVKQDANEVRHKLRYSWWR